MTDWNIHAYKAQLDAAIKSENWGQAERIRVAVKRRLIEMLSRADSKDAEAVRDAFADSFDKLRLGKSIRIVRGALSTATRLENDAETAGIATEVMPLSLDAAQDVHERILLLLASGNQRPMTTTELAEKTGHRIETIARAIGKLRADRKITSRRVGRNVLHRISNSLRIYPEDIFHNNVVAKNFNELSIKLSGNSEYSLDKNASDYAFGAGEANSVTEVVDSDLDLSVHDLSGKFLDILSQKNLSLP